MPSYTYECSNHGTFDEIMTISEFKRNMPCPSCGKEARNIIVLGHGGVWRNDSEWVRGVSKVFEVDGHKPFETVQDYHQFLKDNPSIKPKESHPALPSSIGDCPRKPDKATRWRTMKKQAMEYLRKSEALTVNSGTSA